MTCLKRVITSNILVVAARTCDGWKARIGIVPGKNHDEEWEDVLRFGQTLDEDLARFMFPAYSKVPYGR